MFLRVKWPNWQCQSTEGSSSPTSHQVHLSMLQAYTCMQYTVKHKIHTYTKKESKHSEMGPVRQNPIQRTVRSVHVCALHCAQVLHRTDLIIFPLTLQTITTAPMISICGKGLRSHKITHLTTLLSPTLVHWWHNTQTTIENPTSVISKFPWKF